MRSTALITALVATAVAGSATAAPSFSLVWTGTTGSGIAGADVIAALPGDTLTLDVLIQDIDDGVYHMEFELLGSNVTALSGQACPLGSSGGSSENLIAGTCFSADFEAITELVPGVTVTGSDIFEYEAGGIVHITGVEPLPLFVGRGVFQVLGTGQVDLANGLIIDDAFNEFTPSTTATIVPEPGTAALLGIGIAGLGLARRRTLRL